MNPKIVTFVHLFLAPKSLHCLISTCKQTKTTEQLPLSLSEWWNLCFSELFFSFQLIFFQARQTSFGILILSVLSKAFISPSLASSDNLKSLWCIYLGSGLRRGWQILHNEFAKCLLAASGFKAPWRERRTKPRAWLHGGARSGAGSKELWFDYWHVNVRGPWGGSPQTLPPSLQPHKAQPWTAAGFIYPVRRRAAEVSPESALL